MAVPPLPTSPFNSVGTASAATVTYAPLLGGNMTGPTSFIKPPSSQHLQIPSSSKSAASTSPRLGGFFSFGTARTDSSPTASAASQSIITLSPSLFSPAQESAALQSDGYMDEYYEMDKDSKVKDIQKDLLVAWRNVQLPKQQQLARSELKYLIRRGVPDERRVAVWKLVMGFNEFCQSSDYDLVVAELHGKDVPKRFRNIPSFGGIVSPSDHYVSEDGIPIVKRILSILALNHPEIEYCPVIPDIVHLLLVFMSEVDTYIYLNLLIKSSNDAFYRFLNTSNRECTRFVLTFDSLLEKHIPKLYKHMVSLGITSSKSFCEEWFSRLFVSILPFQTVLHVFDVFVSEGYKSLYRVALGIMRVHKRVLLKSGTTPEAFLSTLRNLNHQLIDHPLLMKKAFKIHLKRNQLVDIDAQQHQKLSHVSEPLCPIYYRPKVTTPSSILEEDDYELLWNWLPHKYCICDPVIVFDTNKDGFNLRLMYEKLEGQYPVFIVIRAGPDSVFGFFTSDELTPNDTFGSVKERSLSDGTEQGTGSRNVGKG
eukprot:gene12371-14513_t